ncbi:M56 family metallopeptidase [Clostridium sp. LP20]|uniref:M56 family metallopeptidase n=1 Tax=Clostridium sp. LP20 TaxID=3418665 RepID=UPI003EE4BA29
MFFLTKIFHNVINISMLASVVVLVIVLFKILFKNKLTANLHYYIWFIVIIRLLIPYFPNSYFSIFNLLQNSNAENIVQTNIIQNDYSNNLDTINPTEGSLNSNILNDNINTSKNLIAKDKHISKTLSIIWIVGLFTIFSTTIFSYFIFLYRNKYSTRLISTELNDLLNECMRKLKINSKIKIYYCNSVTTPTVFGFINKTIIIPDYLYSELSTDDLRYILYHELCHIKRYDIEANFLIMLLQCVHWFNPILWLAFNKSKSDCENACDAFVLKRLSTEKIKPYAETIIKLASIIKTSKSTNLNLGIINKKDIKRRIFMITKFKKKSVIVTLSSCIIIAIISVICLTNPKVEANNPTSIPPDSISETDSPIQDVISNNTKEKETDSLQQEKSIKQAETSKPQTVPLSSETVINDKIIYKNNKLGIQLTMPLSWKNKYIINESDSSLMISYKLDYYSKYNDDSSRSYFKFEDTPPDSNSAYDYPKERHVATIWNTNNYSFDYMAHLDSMEGVPRFVTINGTKFVIGGPTDALELDDPDRPGLQDFKKSLPAVLNNIKEIDITYTEK